MVLKKMANVARELLKKQLIELNKDDTSGFSVGLEDDSNFFKWRVTFEGEDIVSTSVLF